MILGGLGSAGPVPTLSLPSHNPLPFKNCQAVPLYLSEMAPTHLRGALNIMFQARWGLGLGERFRAWDYGSRVDRVDRTRSAAGVRHPPALPRPPDPARPHPSHPPPTPLQLATTVGILVAQLVNYWALAGPSGWRVSLACAGVPALVLLVGAAFLPDTPASLYARGYPDASLAVLQRARGAGVDVGVEMDDIKAATAAADAARAQGHGAILRRQYRPELARGRNGRGPGSGPGSGSGSQGLGLGRREALWEARRTPGDALPLFAHAAAAELGREEDARLPAMAASEEVIADYQTTRLSLKAHPLAFLRSALAAEVIISCAEANALPDGRRVRVAGVVLIRQRPGKGNAVFITIEDETAIVNALLWAREMEAQRRAVMGSRLMVIEGEIQRSKEDVVHLMARRVIDRSALLDRLAAGEEEGAGVAGPPPASPRRHPRDVRILPRSRDFH